MRFPGVCETLSRMMLEDTSLVEAVLVIWNNERDKYPGCSGPTVDPKEMRNWSSTTQKQQQQTKLQFRIMFAEVA